eukprot:TRINITY_DN4021_c0_g1_i1.p1 TRINITY_DN4021_c0_g1~~TRINITY_DN4021_c0_g1_i1.p1  ORF type:complete len:299 (-),score=60.71 TRINITY_DN4021_c0_g1_i1:86-982(-)
MLQEDLKSLVSKIKSASASQDNEEIIRLLELFEGVTMTPELLKYTGAGVIINRKVYKTDWCSVSLKNKCDILLKQWRKDCQPEKKKPVKPADPSPEVEPTPTPSPPAPTPSPSNENLTPDQIMTSIPVLQEALYTGDTKRDNLIEKLSLALCVSWCSGQKHPREWMYHLERNLWDLYSNEPSKYMAKARMFLFNIKDKKNPELRDAILSGDWKMSELAQAQSQDLASTALKASNQATKDFELEKILPDKMKASATTDMYQCRKCKKRETTYYQLQTRSADEPMTTFVQCVPCGYRWRF